MIKIEHLTHTYQSEQGKNIALNNLSLEINEGEHLAVLGQNGCGKSTLAKHLNALLLPDKGTVTIDGMDSTDENSLWQIRQKVGMVFQNPDNQLVATTVEEDCAFGPENLGLEPAIIRERVDEALAMVEMTAFKNKAPHLLSGGQKQRVTIAGIIAMRPKYIVFDEPTAMLDPQGHREVIQTMQKLNKEEHITIINITHYMEEAADADYVIVIDDGLIAAKGTPEQLKEEYSKDRLVLTAAETEALKKALAGREYFVRADRIEVPLTRTLDALPVLDACFERYFAGCG